MDSITGLDTAMTKRDFTPANNQAP